MVKKLKKQSTKIDIAPYASIAIKYSPYWAPVLIAIVFFFGAIKPSLGKISYDSRDITKNQNIITTVTAGKAEFERTKKDLKDFKIKVAEFDKRLPKIKRSDLIIETFQGITGRSDLQLSSLKPAAIIRHKLEETNDVFVELPVILKLKCGYYELIDFLEKLEKAEQLMKITKLSIRNNPRKDWTHAIEFSISTFSKEESPN